VNKRSSGVQADICNVSKYDFNALCTPNYQDLLGFAIRLTKNETEAHDVVQDAMVKALNCWDGFNPKHSPEVSARAWLFQIVANTFLDNVRKNTRRGKRAKTAWNVVNGTYGVFDDGTERGARNECHDETVAAVEALSDDLRRVVELVDIQGFKYREAAKVLDVSMATVTSRLHRARKVMTPMLEPLARDNGYSK
jgi:RNA polymerase sigma factor (sigma-70 family)